ncbi:MAG: hypothetical protein EOP11_07660 [Proteobacteria bacterium]|nr:MAG: hypothetical protein EOP11_07660 [Pseudomonadota bacterium]
MRPYLFLTLLLLCPLASRAEALDPMLPGPLTVESGEYKFPATLDPQVLTTMPTELWAKAFWPRTMRGPRPIVFFLHGNHPTCASPGKEPGTHSDSNCDYTYTGTCPAGMVPTPNHEGFSYAASHLASQGYVVVSINANRGITCGDAVRGDEALNLARGRLILRHIEKWQAWSREGGAPASLGTGPDAFLKHVDLTRIGLVGHSRGGEGVRAAHFLSNDPKAPWRKILPDARVRGIFEIGATDGQTDLTLNAENVAWNQLIPMCDGDVPDFDGRGPFERMWRLKAESTPAPKSLFLVWGANHNFFNTEWQSNDAARCSGQTRIHGSGPWSEAQQKIGKASITAFFRANLAAEGETPAANIFDPAVPLPKSLTAITRIDRDSIPTFDRRYFFPLETFDGLTPARPEARGEGVKFTKDLATPNRARIEWKDGAPMEQKFFQVKWEWPYAPRSLSELNSLGFRLALDAPPTYGSTPNADFQIALIDEADQISAVLPASRYAQVQSPLTALKMFQTVSIPLRDFALRTDEISRIRGVRFLFPNGQGTIYLTGIHFTRKL